MRAAQSGDAAAFGRLVERHWCEMVRLARSVAGNGDAEDCVQEGLLDAWHALPRLADPERFRGWLGRIVFRRALRAARWRKLRSLFAWVPDHAVVHDPESEIDLARLLDGLPPRQRAVLHLTIVEEMTDTEIGEVLSISAGSVRAHRRRARQQLSSLTKRGKP